MFMIGKNKGEKDFLLCFLFISDFCFSEKVFFVLHPSQCRFRTVPAGTVGIFLTGENTVFRPKNLYRSGTEKSRLSDLKKKKRKKKGFAYRSNIPKAVTFWFSFPHNAAGSTLLMVIPFRRAPFFFFPMRPYQVSFFFSSISFAFSNSFYLSFLILYAESADQG